MLLMVHKHTLDFLLKRPTPFRVGFVVMSSVGLLIVVEKARPVDGCVCVIMGAFTIGDNNNILIIY